MQPRTNPTSVTKTVLPHSVQVQPTRRTCWFSRDIGICRHDGPKKALSEEINNTINTLLGLSNGWISSWFNSQEIYQAGCALAEAKKKGYGYSAAAGKLFLLLLNSGKLSAGKFKFYGLSINDDCSIDDNIELHKCTVDSAVTVKIKCGSISAACCDAVVIATGHSAIAYATVSGSKSYAIVRGAEAQATSKYTEAFATANGAIAKAVYSMAKATATVYGAVAQADYSNAEAYATANGAIAEATAWDTEVFATVNGAIAKAMSHGSKAYAEAAGATAILTGRAKAVTGAEHASVCATANGAVAITHLAYTTAFATTTGAIAEANVPDSYACATAPGAIARAKVCNSRALSKAHGAEAYAMVKNSSANAIVAGAIAIATESGSEAVAQINGAIAKAVKAGATAYAMGERGAKAYALIAGATAISTENGATAQGTVPGTIAYATTELMIYEGGINKLEHRLGYKFTNIDLLKQALTHKSCCGKPNYERLEFVGDGVLNSAIAFSLYRMYPKADEGMLSKMRAVLVDRYTLAKVARANNLSSHLYLGSNEANTGCLENVSILAGSLEAIFAAISLDSSTVEANKVIESLYRDRLHNVEKGLVNDSKSSLQEYAQARGIAIPKYTKLDVSQQGNRLLFTVECVIPELGLKECAVGSSKKDASQLAAQKLLAQINYH